MATVYAYRNFNNYYNKRVKGQNIKTITDFMAAYGDYDYMQTGTGNNFNENDGVITSHVLGRQSNPYFGDCDYLLVCSDNNNIDSKWFIVDQNKQCYGQYKLNLYRDVIADNWENILSADCYIEKAIIPSTNNLIFNQENISVNQIKKRETLLKDESGCAWIVGYLAHNYAGGNVSITANVIADYSAATLTALETALSVNKGVTYREKSNNNKVTFAFSTYAETPIGDFPVTFTYNKGTDTWTHNVGENAGMIVGTWKLRDLVFVPAVTNALNANFDNTVLTTRIDSLTPATDHVDNASVGIINSISGKIAEIASGTNEGYNRITVTNSVDHLSHNYSDTSINDIDDIIDYFNSFIVSDLSQYSSGYITNFDISRSANSASYDLESIPEGQYSVTMPTSANRYHLKDAPYDMFCIPYGNKRITNSQVAGFTAFNHYQDTAISIAQGLAKELGSNIIDLQLVPYCPMTGLTYPIYGININNASTRRYTIVEDTNHDSACLILWSTASKGTKSITYNITVDDTKISNQCDLYRLVSPNYNGQFEFNPAMNDGASVFNVDFTYIPYQPYIHINPVFTRMYGGNYKDARGLICGGDFSLSYLTDKWAEYQVQNKNFSNIFDREIQNMQVNHKYDMIQSGVGAAVGAASQGVTMGLLTGNPAIGIAAGAISAAGGVADMAIKEELHNEAISYKTDIHNYQLDNIKALPYSLAKCSTINVNNKIFPFIEYYSCSDEEREAFANKIAWDSMSINVIGKLENYIYNNWSYNGIEDKGFVKAKLLRINGVKDDTHVVNAIADELNKGVYTK